MDEFFYHNSIKTYITAFGNMFNNIKTKTGAAPTKVVPIRYASKEKFIDVLQSNNGDATTHAQVEQIIPAMAYELTDITYDPIRKINTLQEKLQQVTSTNIRRSLSPTPFDLTFTLHIFTRYGDHMLQIVEQIMPFFQPSFNIVIKERPEIGISQRDVSVVLSSVASDNTYIGEAAERRHIEWTLTFVMKAWLYPNFEENFNVINRVIVDFGINPGEATLSGIEFITEPFGIDEETTHIVRNAITYYEPFIGDGFPSPNMPSEDSVAPTMKIVNHLLTVPPADRDLQAPVSHANYYAGYSGIDQYIESDIRFGTQPGALYFALRGALDTVALYACTIDTNNGSAVLFSINSIYDAYVVDVLPVDTFTSGDIVRFEVLRVGIEDFLKVYVNNVLIHESAAIPVGYTHQRGYPALAFGYTENDEGLEFGYKWIRVGSYE